VNSHNTICSSSTSGAFPKPMLAALEQLQAQTGKNFSGYVYVYDLAGQYTVCASRSISEVLGYTADNFYTFSPNGLANLIHPDDLDSVADYYQRLSTLKIQETISTRYRMRRSDGTWCLLQSQETRLEGPDECPSTQVLGVLQEVSQITSSISREPMLSGKQLST